MNEHERPVMARARSMVGDVREESRRTTARSAEPSLSASGGFGDWPWTGKFARIHSNCSADADLQG